MSLFNKKGPEIVDYTLLEKKGLLKKRKEKKLPFKINSGGFVEFGAGSESNIADEFVKERNNSESQSPFSFLDNLAGAASASAPALENEKDLSNTPGVNDYLSSDVNTLKVKIDDLEYKLERFIEKLSAIEEKIANFERKTGRN